MLEGRVKQIDTPEKIYSNPKTPFAADFLGSANLIPVNVVHSQNDQWQAILPNGPKIPVPPPGAKKTGEYLLMLRQEELNLHFRLSPAPTGRSAVTSRRYSHKLRSWAS